jgi:hypothetical protein
MKTKKPVPMSIQEILVTIEALDFTIGSPPSGIHRSADVGSCDKLWERVC